VRPLTAARVLLIGAMILGAATVLAVESLRTFFAFVLPSAQTWWVVAASVFAACSALGLHQYMVSIGRGGVQHEHGHGGVT